MTSADKRLYDEVQISARLCLCLICRRWWYMTKPQVLCVTCKREREREERRAAEASS